MAGCAHVARALRIGVIARRVRPSVRSYTRGQVLLQFHPAHMAKTTRPRPAAAGAFLSSCSPKKVTAEGTIEASGAGCWVHRHLHREVRLPSRTRRTRKGAPSKAPRPRDFGNVQIQDDTEGAPSSDDERMDAVGGACRLGRSVIGMLSLNRPTAKCDEIVQAGDLIFGFLFAALLGSLDWPFGCARKSIATVMNITIWLFGAMRTRICSTAQCGIFCLFFQTKPGYKVASFPLGDD
jgi:hypothetical protein